MPQDAVWEQKMAAMLDSVGQKVQACRKEDSLVFLYFSDLHTDSAQAECVQQLCRALQMTAQRIGLDAVVDLGDNLNMLGRNFHATNETVKTVLSQLFAAMTAGLNCPFFAVNGNHDAIGTDFFKPDFWNDIVKNGVNHASAVYAPEGAAYYADHPASKTRMIFLSLPHDSDLYGEYPRPFWEFGAAQLRWLAQEALNTSYQVILLTHVPFFYQFRGDNTVMLKVWNGEAEKVTPIGELCGWIHDCGTAGEILHAFAGHLPYENEALDIRMPASAPTAGLAGCFSGHTHADALWMPGEERGENKNSLPCCQTVIRTARPLTEEEPECCGVCMDVAVWTPSSQEFRIFRIGAGEDRQICLHK